MKKVQLSKKLSLLLLVFSLLTGCGTYSSSQAEPLTENDAYRQEEIAVRNDPIWTDEKNLRAMIISDLHYTENKDANPAIVPGIALAEEVVRLCEEPNNFRQSYELDLSIEEKLDAICKQLNFTSLRYNRLDDMIAAVGLPKDKLCTYCWDGRE